MAFTLFNAINVDPRGRSAALLTGRESKKRRWEESARGQEHVALQTQVRDLQEQIQRLQAGLLAANQSNAQMRDETAAREAAQ